MKLFASFLCLTFLFFGCAEANFKGKTPSKKTKPVDKNVSVFLGCEHEYNKVFPVEATANELVHIKVSGEVCLKRKNELTVLFVVDFSGSMGRHTPSGEQAENPGNDPQIADSCGRLAATQAIVNKLTSEFQHGDTVRVGLIPFAGGVLQQRIIEPLELEIFSEDVTKENLCSYVVQNSNFGLDPQNPGGISGGTIDSATNYQAAFQQAELMMKPIKGRKVVYFVSDGQPTSGGADPIAVGVEAGRKLKEIEDLELNSLLLGNDQTVALDVLKQISGDESQVRVAGKAGELAEEILKFPEPTLKEPSAKALLTVADSQRDLELLEFSKQDTGKWHFATEAIDMSAPKNQSVDHKVVVSAENDEGILVETAVTLRFTQK